MITEVRLLGMKKPAIEDFTRAHEKRANSKRGYAPSRRDRGRLSRVEVRVRRKG